MNAKLVSICLSLLVGLWFTVVQTTAQDVPKAHLFDGQLADGTKIQVAYVPSTGKLGLITKDAAGKPTSAHMFYKVADTSERFYRTASDSFGKVNDELFVYFELSGLQGDSITITVDGKRPQSLVGQEPVPVTSLAPFGNCRNYCYPSNPDNYNWYQCFWCCATTGNDPC
jgi:hypothetical protein